jgi:hypothetical protein
MANGGIDGPAARRSRFRHGEGVMGEALALVVETLTRVIEDLGARVTGPMHFRLILQPLMAAFIAIRSGVADARASRPPYFWAMFTDRGHRGHLLREGGKDAGKVFAVAIVLDVVYQVVVDRWVFPGEALIVAVLLAIVPYLLLRGLANHVTSSLAREHAAPYNRFGRPMLAAASVAGWATAVLVSVPHAALITGFGLISGGVIMNSMVTELPGGEGRFWLFVTGAIGYALVLSLVR